MKAYIVSFVYRGAGGIGSIDVTALRIQAESADDAKSKAKTRLAGAGIAGYGWEVLNVTPSTVGVR